MPSSIRSRPERPARAGWLLAVALLLALGPVSARAAPAETRAAAGDAKAQARVKFAEGNTAYEAAQYQKALDAYSEAYRLLPLPGFLFNIAQCQRQLGQPEAAAASYRRYLSQSKQPPANAPLVRELIAEMDGAVAKEQQKKASSLRKQTAEVAERRAREDSERARAVAPKAAPGAEVQGESLAKKWWVWAGAGVVAVAAGSIVYAATAPQPRPTTLGTVR